MFPSLIPTPSVSWEEPASLPFLNSAQLPAFHNLGRSFLIDNLLRVNGPSAGNPFPVKVPQTAEQISPSGGPRSTRPSFQQLVNPSPAPATSSTQTASYPEIGLPGFAVVGPVSSRSPPLLFRVSHSKVRRGILRRVVFSEEQRKALEKTFQKQKYISKTDRKKLATHLGLKDSQVKIWFQNRRMKWRNTKERELLTQGCLFEQTLQEKSVSTSDNAFPNVPDRKAAHVGQASMCKYVAISTTSQDGQAAEGRVADLKREVALHSDSVQHKKDT